MKRSIEKLRYEYGNRPLLEEALTLDPLELFEQWLEEAIEAEVMEPNGMTLATVSRTGKPASRTVLLKGLDAKGLIFYTHYTSRKGEQLAAHPFGSLTFWWKEIFRQVNIEGSVQRASRRESLEYFRRRPRGAQLAACLSHQSEPLASRLELDEAFKVLKRKYQGRDVPCPKEWGGYRLVPDRVEFWQGRSSRLHDRFVYVKTNGEWALSRLAP